MADFPAIITQLPEVDIHFPGVRGWLLLGDDHQIGFFDVFVLASHLSWQGHDHIFPITARRDVFSKRRP